MIYQLKPLVSRAATQENPKALPGAGGMAEGGRKGAPCIENFLSGSTVTLLDTEGPGMIRHIWCTIPPGRPLHLRNLILRIFWDDHVHPSVQVPLGDFFGMPHGAQSPMTSELIAAQAGKGLNCWIPMPFKKRARITIENDSGSDVQLLFYQIDFTLGDELGERDAYFHAQFRRANPCPIHEDFEILATCGRGAYLGTILGVRSLYNGAWWGEGEVKFFLDGEEYPTICGTGVEDYIGCAWGLNEISTPMQGCQHIDPEQGCYSMYRLHTKDPIYFAEGIKVTVQQIGYGLDKDAAAHYGKEHRRYRAAGAPKDGEYSYFDREDDYSSVALWYQIPIAPQFPVFPGRAERSADLPAPKARKTDANQVDAQMQ